MSSPAHLQPSNAEASYDVVQRASRICVITAGHLSTCPRMLKAADSLADAGYRVRVVSANCTAWAQQADEDLQRSRVWTWARVDYNRRTAPLRYRYSGLRLRVAKWAAKCLGLCRCPLPVAARACSRVYPELVRTALAEPAELFYGGSTGGLAAVAAAGRLAGKPYALDLEDFHSVEQAGSPAAHLANALAERIERRILSGAAFLTAGSRAIASAYEEKYGVRPVTINNTFPLRRAEPDFSCVWRPRLRLYWFSQTIGPNRGLEDVVGAVRLAGIGAELHLRGRPAHGYLDRLRALAADAAPSLEVVHHPPGPPDAMVDLCRDYDIGLAIEQPHVLNRDLCLTNKAFTYMLAGLALVFTDTRGQRPLADELGDQRVLYPAGDVQMLAAGLRRWSENRDLLRQARIASWQAARRRWHWEHPLERGALLDLVSQVFRGRDERLNTAPVAAGQEAMAV